MHVLRVPRSAGSVIRVKLCRLDSSIIVYELFATMFVQDVFINQLLSTNVWWTSSY